MDVTRDNFEEAKGIFKKALDECDYVSFDTEFTGLHYNDEDKDHLLDTPEERYEKLRDIGNIHPFLIIQLGVSLFKFVDIGVTSESYTFWVFPWDDDREAWFTCQASSISFLSKAGFDFNKLFKGGIGYMSRKDEEMMLNSIYNKDDDDREPYDCLSDKDKSFIEDMVSIIRRHDPSSTTTISLPMCNPYRRRLCYKHLPRFFPSIHLCSVEDPRGGGKTICARILSYDERISMNDDEMRKRLDDVREKVGVRWVLDVLLQSGKMMVGHNMFRDLMLIWNQFIGPLPTSMEEWCDGVCELYPEYLMDTRVMLERCDGKRYSGKTLIGCYNEEVEEMDDDSGGGGGGTSHQISKHHHDAGYDSYMTGYLFHRMVFHSDESLDHIRHTYSHRISLMKNWIGVIDLKKDSRGDTPSSSSVSVENVFVILPHDDETCNLNVIKRSFNKFGYVILGKQKRDGRVLCCIGALPKGTKKMELLKKLNEQGDGRNGKENRWTVSLPSSTSS